MTYAELLVRIYNLSPERLQDTVTVWNSEIDEFQAVSAVDIADDNCDVLDTGHLFLVVD